LFRPFCSDVHTPLSRFTRKFSLTAFPEWIDSSVSHPQHRAILFHITIVNLLLILLLVWQGQLIDVLYAAGKLLNIGQLIPYRHHAELVVTGLLAAFAAAFTIYGSYSFCRDSLSAYNRAKDSLAMTFDDALAMSYLLHVVFALGVLLAATVLSGQVSQKQAGYHVYSHQQIDNAAGTDMHSSSQVYKRINRIF
jgi:hypothetical protein